MNDTPESSHESGNIVSLRQSEERFRLMIEGVKDYAIFLLDPDGYVSSWNAGAERIKGYTAEEIIGHHFSEFYPQEKIDEGWPEHELKVAQAEGRFEDEGWRLRKDGSRFWANVVITALFENDGTLCCFTKITRDLTERREQEERLRQSEERFRLMIEGVKDYAIFLLDPDGYVSSWNAGAERIKGYKAEEIIGHHFSEFYPQEKIDQGWPQHELTMAVAEGRFEDEGWRLRKDGSRFWANVVITPLYTQDGSLYGFAKVTRDMTDRRRVEELEISERRMIEFLAMLSHELRNPLAPIRNAVYLMQSAEIDNTELKWASEVIDRQAAHLTRLVDDLLEVSRVTSGNIKLHKEHISISTIIERSIESSRPLIDARRHTLEVVIPATPLVVEGDITRLTQIVVNLLNNAARYTPEGGMIRLQVEEQTHVVLIHVQDSGIGLAPDMLTKVFDIFVQGERALDRSDGGLGIGLTLVRRLVEMHGGSVEALSRGRGEGSEFIVTLPRVVSDNESGEDTGTTRHDSDTPRTPNQRVLIVDDNRDGALSLSMLLQAWGYDVSVAYDGISGLETAQQYKPHIVLLDIGLPMLNGYEVAEQLRKLPEGKSMYLIALTGYGQEEDRRRTREAGFDKHLIKPIDPVTLRGVLSSIGQE